MLPFSFQPEADKTESGRLQLQLAAATDKIIVLTALVAQLDRVSDSDSEGRRFEPYRARHFDLDGLFEREVLFFTLNSDLRRFLYGRIQFDW